MKPAKVQIFSWSTRKVPSLFSKLQSLEQVQNFFQVFFLVMDASFNAYHFCTCFWHRFSPPQRLLLFVYNDGRFFSLSLVSGVWPRLKGQSLLNGFMWLEAQFLPIAFGGGELPLPNRFMRWKGANYYGFQPLVYH